MTDDWTWLWTSDSGRDRILRDEVEGLNARLASASSQTHRLSSQLATLSGSLESRLSALSTAFDAYVELGDVREQLAAYDEPAAVRREVLLAVEAMAAGRPAAPVDGRGLDYWLPEAMNAVAALIEGRPDDGTLERARTLSAEADLFVVAACGALGRGEAVVDLLPTVLVGDSELTEQQQRVWRAAAAGAFGALPDGLAAVWRPLLDREPVAGWTGWIAEHAAAGPAARVGWLHELVTQGPPEPVADHAVAPLRALRAAPSDAEAERSAPTSAEELRIVVTDLISRGMPAETELLHRARELRERIEHPNRAAASREEAPSATVVSEIRRSLLNPSTSPGVRSTLLTWTSVPLAAVLDELVAAATAAPPAVEVVRGGGGVIEVRPTGADPAVVAAGVARLEAAYAVPNPPVIGWAVAAGVALVLTLVLGVAGSDWAWFFGMLAVAGGIGLGRQLVLRRRTQATGREALQRFQQEITAATAAVEATERQRTTSLVQLTGEAAALRERLAAPASAVRA